MNAQSRLIQQLAAEKEAHNHRGFYNPAAPAVKREAEEDWGQ
jgi:hypothetical protein